MTVSEIAPLSLMKTLKLTGRSELASLRTEVARSGQRIRIRSRSGWGAGVFLGAWNLLTALVRGGGPLGKAASTMVASLEAVVAGRDFLPLPLPRQAAAFAAIA